jgi:hypothetical protein
VGSTVTASNSPRFVIGWKLHSIQRAQLLKTFVPLYPNKVADHVTFGVRNEPNAPLPVETQGDLVGQVDDESGVQALIVSIGGTTARPDGGTYHITWSLGPGREAAESNDVIAQLGWHPLPEPIAIGLIPTLL